MCRLGRRLAGQSGDFWTDYLADRKGMTKKTLRLVPDSTSFSLRMGIQSFERQSCESNGAGKPTFVRNPDAVASSAGVTFDNCTPVAWLQFTGNRKICGKRP